MYEVADDTYCYPGTTVLKIDIRQQELLDEFETEMTNLRAAEPLPSGNLDYEHYRNIHRHLFQDVYNWQESRAGPSEGYLDRPDRWLRPARTRPIACLTVIW
jgi:hypothetical protein